MNNDFTAATPRTLVEVLRQRAETHPEVIVYTFLVDGETQEKQLTFGQLWAKARAIAAKLNELGAKGARALLLYPPGLDFAPALFGCFLAGVVAVPEGPPDLRKPERSLARLDAVAADAQAAFVLAPNALLPLQAKAPAGLSQAQWIATDVLSDPPGADDWELPDPSALAYLQYTSGSTADPKGVMLNHGHFLHNCRQINGPYGLDAQGITVSWVPAFHDLGLLYAVAMPIFTGSRCVSFGAAEFVQRPIRWLWAISRHRGTHSIAPNTAFDLAVLKTRESERRGLDLSSWRVLLNGAEPIYRESEERFVETYAPFGFDRAAISHALGMAEATAKVSAEPVGERMIFVTLDSEAFAQQRIVEVPEGTPGARVVAGCGKPAPDTTFAVVDPETGKRLPADHVGELWIQGPSVGQGYWNKPAATAETYGAKLEDSGDLPWLRTGDLGFLRHGHVFVAGRWKDVLIVRGQNHHPQDLEGSLRGVHAALRPGAAVVFSMDAREGERVVVVAEMKPEAVSDAEAIHAAIRRAIADHGLRPSIILLAAPGAIPKTTSGKLQRRKTRQLFLDGELTILSRWDAPIDAWQLVALQSGRFESLSRVPQGASKPEPGQVQIEVRAAGLNFRDVLTALGLYPGALQILGQEGAGIVVAVGEGVNDVAPGERVFGLLPGAFASVVNVDRHLVTPIPQDWDFERSASIPVAFVTAWFGLVHLAQVRPGQRVLIHAAAGGVGMAAVQIARHLGAEVYATANPTKWDALRAMGLAEDHLASSRDLEFAHRFPRVDVVLNSLTGDFIDASLRLLTEGGRFIELGKRDLRQDVPRGVTYRSFDVLEAGAHEIATMLREIVALFESGALKPLPVRTWPIDGAEAAFRFMARAKHQGKLVLAIKPGLAAEQSPSTSSVLNDAEVEAIVIREIATTMGLGTHFDAHRPLGEYGLDSLLAAEMSRRLGSAFVLALPVTFLYDYPTASALAREIEGRLRGSDEQAGVSTQQRAFSRHDDPIAIVGMACRFPGGVSTPEDLWTLLERGHDAITAFPTDRGWNLDALYDADPDAIGKTTTRGGGFLSGPGDFEPEFFGISAREAAAMDPQQRILLELAWEAIERAGVNPAILPRSATGVFVGICYDEYGRAHVRADQASDGYAMLGSAPSIASGRIAYALGLEGPALTIDTACSSSLVAVHLACRALRDGECNLALCGGATVFGSPDPFLWFSRLRTLSPDGRSRAFADSANGAGWSEGAGMLVLERLSDARRNGHPVLAILRGSAINQDGRSQGLTAPNGPAQRRVIRAALADAGLEPSEIDAVEAHGTGTKLGDPIEAGALLATYGQGRPEQRPLWLGTIKSNIGHTQAAAGVAGLIKMVLAMRHERLPKTLHVDAPSPFIDWSTGAMELLVDAMPWPRREKPRRAGVSSFGLSGTNAHVIVEEAPRDEERPIEEASSHLLPLSGKTPVALVAMARSYRDWLSTSDERLRDIVSTASARRNHFEHRLGVVGSNKEEIVQSLEAFIAGEVPPTIVMGQAAQSASKVVFVFPGQGSQWVGMGRQLYREEPAFREALVAGEEAIRKEAGFSILEELDKPEETSRLQETIVAQPALFAVEVALARLLQSWGVVPSAVVGHSVGEIAAAHIAGGLDLEQAARLVVVRGRVMQKATGQGKMVSVALSEDDARKAITGWENRVGIAAVNDPNSVVLSGDIEVIDRIVEQLSANGVQTRSLRVNYGFHSPQMEPLLGEFTEALGHVTAKPVSIPVLSTVTGKPIADQLLDTTYWAQNIRQTVRFADALASIASSGRHLFVEVGPHPVLGLSMEQTISTRNIDGKVVPTLRRDRDERKHLLGTLGALYANGYAVDWKRLYPGAGQVVQLPTYPWQRQRYWLDTPHVLADRTGETTGHPLLGARVPAAGMHALFETLLRLDRHSWLGDHRVMGQVFVPAAAIADLVWAAAAQTIPNPGVTALTLQAPLVLPEHGGRRLQVVLTGENGTSISIYSQPEGSRAGDGWTLHATATVAEIPNSSPPPIDLAAAQSRCAEALDVNANYTRFGEMGLSYGPAFQGLKAVWRGKDEAIAQVALPNGLSADGFGVHPALLDAAFQTMAAAMEQKHDELLLPFELGGWVVQRTGADAAWVHVRVANGAGNITLCDSNGAVIAEVRDFRLQPANVETLRGALTNGPADCFYRLEWRNAPSSTDAYRPDAGRWILVANATSARAAALASRLADCIVTTPANLDAVLSAHDEIAGLVCLWETDADEPAPDAALRLSAEALTVVQTLQRLPRPQRRLLWVTRNAVASSTLWGLGRTVFLEEPDQRLVLVDLAEGADMDVLLRELSANDGENQVVWRGNIRHVARLVRANVVEDRAFTWPKDGTVLVTGGLGALGLQIAKWLASRGVAHLVLTGRRGMNTPGAAEAIAEISKLGTRVTVSTADVANRAALEEMLANIPHELPLRGIIHAAVVLDDGVIGEQDAGRFARVFAPKVFGAWNLHELTKGTDLGFFVLLSSIAGLVGSAGQSNYAAANSFLDALAEHRHSLGLPAQSLAWSAWADVGQAAALDAAKQARISHQGIRWIKPAEGMALFERAVALPETTMAILPLDLHAVRRSFDNTVPPVWRALVRTEKSPIAPARIADSWENHLASLPLKKRADEVRSVVHADVARVLGISGAVPADRPFQEMGLDSLMAVELRNALGRRVSRKLPATLAFDHPTIDALTQWLLDEIVPQSASVETPPIASAHEPAVDLQRLLGSLSVEQLRAAGLLDALLALAKQNTAPATSVQTEALTTIPRRASKDARTILSSGQQRLWYLDRIAAGMPLYNLTVGVHMTGPLDRVALERTLVSMVERHASLRTIFPEIEGQYWATQLPTKDITYEFVDLSAEPLERRAEIARHLGTKHGLASFDIAQGPLHRVILISSRSDEHFLFITQHHLITDAWSMGLLLADMARCYSAYITNDQPDFPALPIDYADYAAWERAARDTDGFAESLAWWKNRLRDLPRLDLPISMSNTLPTHAGATVHFVLSREPVSAIKEFARREGCTLFVALLAVWATLLHRYSGQADFPIGTVTANRGLPELRSVVGFFVNTLVLRCDVSPATSFAQLTHRLRDVVVEALRYETIPFDEIVRAVRAERGRDLNPLIQAMFVLESAPIPVLDVPSMQWTPLLGKLDGSVESIAKFNLCLTLMETPEGLRGTLEYATDLFERADMERMVLHFETLLRNAVGAPEMPLDELPMLTEAERTRILGYSNHPPKAFPRSTITDLFAAQVAARPDAVALTFQSEALTYRQLDEQAEYLARRLRARGVRLGSSRVGVCLERSLDLCVALLAVLKAGGAYVPLEPAYPVDRIQFVVDDAGLDVVITEPTLVKRLPEQVHPILVGSSAEESFPASNGRTAPNPDDVAYVIYTSGSTGRPKGVEVTHGQVTRLFSATDAWFHFGPEDVWTLFHSYAFDFSVWEIWGALLFGGRLVVVSKSDSRNPEAFHALVSREHVTVLNQTPSAFRQFIQADFQAAENRSLGLRTVIFGGEALDPTMLRSWFDRHGDEQPLLVNMYGITETTVHVTYRPITKADAARPSSFIGQPIPDLELYVLDARGSLAPIGVPGELWVGGAGVSRGYLNRPELTAERFVPRHRIRAFAENASPDGAMLYRSGDRARLVSSGDLEYLGRIDTQVKIRGFRIELGEIEATLAAHPDVRECVVLGQDGTDGHRYLAAYVVSRGSTMTAAALRAHAQARLPDYMVPATFTFLLSMPLNENGKIDRKELIARGQAAHHPVTTNKFVPPESPREQLLAEIWADVLGSGPVGIHDNFFELGGDSILSIRVMGRAREAGLDFSLQDLFKHPTIRDLVQSAFNGTAKAKRTAPFSLCSPEDRLRLPDEVEDAHPLAAMQAGMFYQGSLQAGSGVYHDMFSYQLRAPVDRNALELAWKDVIRRHSMFRTGFAMSGYSQPLALVFRDVDGLIEWDDLSGLPPEEQDRAIERWFVEERKRGFDTIKPPLLRLRIHRRGEAWWNLSVSFHHAILDGWSNSLLLTELLQRYFALRRDPSSAPIPASALDYRDFVALERSAIASADDRRYWQEKLADMTLLELPQLAAGTSPSEQTDGMISRPIAAGVLEGLRQLALSAGVPIKSALLAAHLRVLAAIANQNDSQTGLVTNGRIEDEGGEQVIGLFLNTVPFRMKIEDDSWEALAKRVFHAECEMLPHRRLPLSEIQALAGGERVFTTGFNFIHFHAVQALSRIEGLEVVGAKIFERHNYTLAVIFSIDPLTGGLSVNFVHDTAAISDTYAQRIATYYERTLAAMAAAPRASCLSFSPLTAEEREEILRASRGASLAAHADKLAHEYFDERAAQSPNAVALVGPALDGTARRLTYAETAARANDLALRLASLGVGPGERVGVYLSRSIDLVVCFLAILKAGGTYLPLDPGYPQDRLEFMLQDARPRLVLTSRALASSLPTGNTNVFLLDAEDEQRASSSEQTLLRPAKPEDPAYIIYTSGTTGRPRGVLVPHRGLPNLAFAQIEAFGVTSQSRVLQFASPNFDASISEFLMALCSGAALHLPTPEVIRSSDALIATLRDDAITQVTLPPSLLALLPEVSLPELSSLIVAGEACPPAVAARWARGRRFLNAYGPTETTVCASIADVTEADTREATLHIGKPMAGVEVFILDERLALVPVGTPGEICVGGMGVALGYVNQPELTAMKFVDNPFGPGRLYRTGDLGRMRPDGRIAFLGRKDEQVKLRGFRIEPEEIRGVLNEHPEVRDSVVVVRDNPGIGKQLVAYVARKQAGSELWPSTFEYLIYDELLYHAMTTDDRRVTQYKAAIEKVVPGRVVVEIGTGPHAVLTEICARAGAKKVYSIEINPDAHRSAKQRIESLGLGDVVELICGDARTVQLPELADVCVSAITGAIGGTEGAAVILNDARRLLRPGGVMLPERMTTRMTAISLPDEIHAQPRFNETGRHYLQKIFEHVGRRFDVRLCLSKVTTKNHLAGLEIFEDLDFSHHVPLAEEHSVTLEITKPGRFDGFLVGVRVTFTSGVDFDILDGEQSQLPIFFPIFDPGIEVEPGDRIVATCIRSLSENGIHPDFVVRGKLVRNNGDEIAFEHETRQLETRYKATPFYRRLFVEEERRSGTPTVAEADRPLQTFLRRKLPEYMLPAHIVEVSDLPRTKNGKIDRRALPNPFERVRKEKTALPETEIEREIAEIWKEVLKIPQVGVHDNFFDLGGHSLLLMIVLGKLQETRSGKIEIVELFEHPTVSSLANHLRSRNLAERQVTARIGESTQAERGALTPEDIKKQRLAARDARRQARQSGRK